MVPILRRVDLGSSSRVDTVFTIAYISAVHARIMYESTNYMKKIFTWIKLVLFRMEVGYGK